MGNYSLDEVIKRWERGTLTTEQAVGQMLLLIRSLSRRVGTLEKAMEAQRNGNSGTVQKDAG